MSSSNLTFNLIANDKASSTVNKFGGTLDKQKSRLEGIKRAAKLAVGAFAVKKVLDFGGGLITAAEDGIKAQAALKNVTTSMGLFGSQTEEVTRRLSAYADKQALATGVDDDAIRATQTKLMTFKEVAKTADEMGGHFDRATAAAIDLAAAGFGTAETNAVQLGKALNDPIKGITALTRSGVTFTEAEKKKIEAMVESGNIAGAQETILKALETQVGGTAAASVTAGDKMRIKWEQVQGTIGEKLLPAYNALSGFVTDKLLPGAESLSSFLSDKLSPAFQVFWWAVTGDSSPGEFEGALNVINRAGLKLHEWGTAVASFFSGTFTPALRVFWSALTGNSEADQFSGHLRTVNNLGVKLNEWIPKAAGFVTGTLVPAFVSVVTWLADAAVWIGENHRWLAALATPILLVVGAWKAYQIGVAAVTAVQTAWNVVTGTSAALQQAYAMGTYGMVAGNTTLTGTVAALTGALWTKITALGQSIAFGARQAAIWTMQTTALAAHKVATLASAGAQRALNLAMSMNPMGLIITAIAALVAGLVWFFTKTEVGKKIWSGFTNFLSSSWENIKRWFSAGWSAVGRYMDLIWNVIKKVWSFTPIGMITSNWDKILAFFRSIPGKLRSFFSNLTNIITSPFKSAFNRIASLWNGTAGKLSFKAPDWVPGIGGKGFSLPQLPMLAKGGILTGPTMFVGGEGGETEVVQPLSKLDRFMRDYVPRDQVKQSGSGGDVMARMHPDDIAALATAMVAAAKRIARGELDAFADGLVGGVR